MKYLVRVYLFNLFALWFTGEILPALTVRGDWRTLAGAAFVLSLLMIFVKPLLKVLFIPVNILTFGLLSWAINVVVIYLLTIIVPEVTVSAWVFPGLTWEGFTIPAVSLNYWFSLIAVSLAVTFFSNLLHDVSEG